MDSWTVGQLGSWRHPARPGLGPTRWPYPANSASLSVSRGALKHPAARACAARSGHSDELTKRVAALDFSFCPLMSSAIWHLHETLVFGSKRFMSA